MKELPGLFYGPIVDTASGSVIAQEGQQTEGFVELGDGRGAVDVIVHDVEKTVISYRIEGGTVQVIGFPEAHALNGVWHQPTPAIF